jgi:hypothetical protein
VKHNRTQFLHNLVECAREIYVKIYSLAVDSDFCRDITKLAALDNMMFETYYKNQNKPKKVFKTLIYVSSMIYNNEIITDFDLCQNLTFLIFIAQYRLYRPHKFIQVKDKNIHYICSGISYDRIIYMTNKLLQGVIQNVNNS